MIFEVTSLSKHLSGEINVKCFNFTLKNSYGDAVATKGIRINTLEELIDFKEITHCDITLKYSPIDNKTPCIEIKDI